MSTHVGNHIPMDTKWMYFDAFSSKVKAFNPDAVKRLYDSGIRKLYLSMGYKYAKIQQQVQQKISPEEWNQLEGLEFEVVVIDSLNPSFSSIRKLFPSKMYLMGTEVNPMFSDVYESWNPENHTNPFLTETGSLERKYFNQIYMAPERTYEHTSCYIQNCWNRAFNMPLIPTPEEKKAIQRKHDLKDSPLGTQIEIISRYANLNWICLNSPPKHPIPEEKFEERYHYLPQAVIRQIPITYSYQGRTFEGGQIVRPLKAYTRYEFEHFFAFGLKCSNFDSQKTRYYYSGNMSTEKGNPNSIFSFLQDFEEAPKDREFLKFLVWTAINYLGVLNSHREKKMADELAESLEISKLTRAELDDLMFPIP